MKRLLIALVLYATAAAAQTPWNFTQVNGPTRIQWVFPFVNATIDSFNNVFTPQAYGAKCDGSTDDSAALQDMINAAAALVLSLPVAIQIPAGKACVFGTTLRFRGVNNPPIPTMALLGAIPKGENTLTGGSALVYTAAVSGPGTPAITFQNTNGPATALTVNLIISNLALVSTTNVQASFLQFSQILGPVTITGNYFNGNNLATNAISCTLACGIQFNITNNFVGAYTASGIKLLGSGPYSIRDNQLFATPVGIYVSGSQATIDANYFESMTDYIEIANDTSESWASYKIEGNTFKEDTPASSHRCLFVTPTNTRFPFYVHGSFKENFCNLSNGFTQGSATYAAEFNTSSDTFSVDQIWQIENNTFLGMVAAAIRNDNNSGANGSRGVSVVHRDNHSYTAYNVSSNPTTVPEINGVGFVNPEKISASLTTTAAATDNVTIPGMTSSGFCQLTPTNAAAATNIATTFVSAKTTNQITVTHTATSRMTYDISCTPN